MKIIFEKKKKGLWANIHAKRERGEKAAKPGDEAYPDKKQWDKLTKEEIEEIVSEEVEKVFEEQEEDPKKSAEKAAIDAQKVATATTKEKQAQIAVNSTLPKEDRPAAQAALKDKIEQEKKAKKNAQDAKKNIEQADSVKTSNNNVNKPVTEEKSNFQKEMEKKGKGWKVRLLTKGKQSAGSAYPVKAPTDRAKSAPPGAGGV
jgi:hypothetical protein